MTLHVDRLNFVHQGAAERTTAGDAATRLAGAGALALCAIALRALHAFAVAPPPHQPTLLEMLFSLVGVLAGMSGAAMLFEGGALFRPDAAGPERASHRR